MAIFPSVTPLLNPSQTDFCLRQPFSRYAVGLMLVSFTFPATAVTWLQEASVPVTREYDSNPRMFTTGEKSVWRTKISPRYRLTAVNGIDQWYADAVLRIERSSNTSLSMDREDPSLDLGWLRELERGSFSLTGQYDERSSRVEELDETGAAVVSERTRRSQSLAAAWQQAVTERMRLSLGGDYKKVSYSGGGTSTLPGYTIHSANAGLYYDWNEWVTPFVQVGASHYQPEGNVDSTNFLNGSLGLQWKINERLNLSAHAGMNRLSGAASSTGRQGGVQLGYITERTSTTVDYSRTSAPSVTGGYKDSDQIRAGWNYELSERDRAGLDFSWRQNRGSNESEVSRLGASYSRELSPFWNLRMSYQYRLTEKNNVPDASANVFGVTLVFSHPDF